MPSFSHFDKDKGIRVEYCVYLEGISLDFDSSWAPGSEVRIYRKEGFDGVEAHLYSIHDCPRFLMWDASTPLDFHWDILYVDYKLCDGGPSRTCVIAGREVQALAQNAEYQCGVAHLEIKRELGFGTNTARFTVRKISEYWGAPFFKLSVVIENINRDEWNQLREYQQRTLYGPDPIVEDFPFAWRGNERVIEQMPKSPHQNDQSDVANDLKHIAYQSMPLVLKYGHAQDEAIEQGLSYDDFQWEFPNHHETRVVRAPSSQTGTPLRALRLDVYIHSVLLHYNHVIGLDINSVDLTITSITRSPSLPNNLSSCTLRLHAPYASLENATIPNSSSQIIEISTDSRSTERVVTTNGLTQTINVSVVQVMGSVTGDLYTAPIHGGNVGGRNNTNNITTPTPDTPSRRKGGVFLLRRFELLPGLGGIFRSTKRREGEARVQEGANSV